MKELTFLFMAVINLFNFRVLMSIDDVVLVNDDGRDEASHNCKVAGTPASYLRSLQHNFNHAIMCTA